MTETLVGKDPYTQFAGLLDYPREDMRSRVDEAVNIISGHPEYPA